MEWAIDSINYEIETSQFSIYNPYFYAYVSKIS